MNLSERLTQDMQQAMKEKDKIRLSVIRMVRAAVKNKEIDSGNILSDEEIMAVIQKELKQRKDSLQAFEQAGRTDLFHGVQEEMHILQEYLPQALTVEELNDLITQIVKDTQAHSKSDVGKVMGQLMPQIRGRSDGQLAQKLVQTILSKDE